MSRGLERPRKVDAVKLYAHVYEGYLNSDYKNYKEYFETEWKISKPTMDKIRKTGYIWTKKVLDIFKQKIDLDDYTLPE